MASEITPGTIVGGRFEIVRLANTGGMGDVYRARDLQTNAPIAVKFVRESALAYAARFDREARALAQFSHPGIVRYIAHGKEPSVYLAMEWLEGEDLSRRLKRGVLSITDTLTLARVLVDALRAAHDRGIIHRDIKPSNIFLVDGRIESAKLLDFGVAQMRQTTYAITMTGQLIGTLGYMAPEQAISGRNVTSAADVFSLGCVLFECLAGRGPFAGEWAEVLSKILLAEAPRLRELRKDIPHPIDELIARMLRKDPATRATIASVAADVEAFLTAGVALGGDESSPRLDVPAVTGDERRLVAVVLGTHGAGKLSEDDHITPSADTIPSSSVQIGHVVARFGGELEVLDGGAPLVTLSSSGAATDLAVRAARCALAMRELLPDAGIAVACGRGDPTRDDSIFAGVVARARELLALDGGREHVRIDSATAGLLDATFEVRGDASALALIGQREQSSVRKLLGKETPCVGRERELSMLVGLASECFDEPLATAVLVTAGAGAGKSRLRHELLRALRERGLVPEVWMARGDPIAAGSAFGTLAQLLRGVAGLFDGEIPEVRRQKLLARIGRNLRVEDATRVAQFLGEIVRAEFTAEGRPALRAARNDPTLMNDQLRLAWEDLVAAETAAGPLVIVLEDLQWGDLPSIRFIDSALRTQRHRPLFVLALARPEVHDVFPGLFRDRRLTEIYLSDLTPSASRKLVLEVLGPNVDKSVVDAIVERAHGNAFYLEELIRSVAEGSSEMPETVLAMAQARLERLEPGARRVLRAASVFGERFWVEGVVPLLGADARADVTAAVDDLVQREVIQREPVSRFQDCAEYTFRHGLVRDAAYQMLTDRDRKVAHLLAAEWLEARGEHEALVLAEHLERSGEKQRAVVWYLWAAEQALAANDLQGVLARAERGIECGAKGAMLGELTLLKAEATGWVGLPRHFELADSALGLLSVGSAAWARAAAELAVASRAVGDLATLRSTAEALASMEASRMASLGHAWAVARAVVELLGEGEREVTERLIARMASAVEHADEVDVSTFRAIVDWLRAAAELYAGAPAHLHAIAGELAQKFEAAGYVRYCALVALHAAIASAAVGEWTAGVTWAERAGDLARRLGLRSSELSARAWLAFHLSQNGLDEIALATARSAVRDAAGVPMPEADARVNLAHVLLATGDVEGAFEQVERVFQRKTYSSQARGRAGALFVRFLLDRDRPDEALAVADETLALLERVKLLGEDEDVRRARAEALERTRKAERR